MSIDTSIAHWLDNVPTRQWVRENAQLAELGTALPVAIAESRPLSEIHRLDLSLFVIFEEASLRVSGALIRHAPTVEAMNFSAQQTLDEARHHEIFRQRLQVSCAALGRAQPEISEALLIPPLQRFLERCYEVVDQQDFVQGLALMNLVFEGMAYPLYAYEQRYWQPVDPYLAALVKSAFVDEARHVAYGAYLVKELLKGDEARKLKVTQLVAEASGLMSEVFAYYIRKFVKLFDTVAHLHRELFADAEFAPGHLIVNTPYQQQVEMIHASIDKQHALLLARAGVN